MISKVLGDLAGILVLFPGIALERSPLVVQLKDIHPRGSSFRQHCCATDFTNFALNCLDSLRISLAYCLQDMVNATPLTGSKRVRGKVSRAREGARCGGLSES